MFHKWRSSNCLPAVGVHAGHPPLTSLRSFAPPYAGAKGAYHLTPFTREMSEGKGGACCVIPNGAKRSEESPAAISTLDEIPRSARNDSGFAVQDRRPRSSRRHRICLDISLEIYQEV